MASGDEIYSNLNSKTLSSVSASDFDAVTDPIHIEKANEDALRTSNLIWQSAFHDGNPMPGGITLETVTVTDNTRTTVWQPETGVVQQLGPVSIELDNNTGSVQFQLYAFDGTNLLYLFTISTSVAAYPIFQDADASVLQPLYFSEDVVLQVVATGIYDGATVICEAIRVR